MNKCRGGKDVVQRSCRGGGKVVERWWLRCRGRGGGAEVGVQRC